MKSGKGNKIVVCMKTIICMLTTMLVSYHFASGQTNNAIAYSLTEPLTNEHKYSKPTMQEYLYLKDTTAKDTTKKTTSQQMEALFKIIPVPLYSYSSEGGNLFGLAKFNAFQLSKSDTISQPSIVSGVASVTTKGRVNFSLSTQLVFNDDKTIVAGYVNYKKQPEYMTKIGNTIYRDSENNVDSIEAVEFQRIKFYATGLFLWAENFYAGPAFEYANYIDIDTDTNSFLARDNAVGLEGGSNVGIGLAAAYDTRDSRYTPLTGTYILSTVLYYPEFLGSKYQFTRFALDARKFFNPWYKHTVALQATTGYSNHDVPFYDLSLLGSDNKMRGYYQGFLRDEVLVDGQVEYRMPVWKMFGITGWMGAGRTSPDYESLTFDDFHLSYGGGFRVRVDTKNNINMRVDFGFGPKGISGTYINFSEAF